MADELSKSEQTQILADSLGISRASYASRESDALVAMTLLKHYRTLPYSEQRTVLYRIGIEMRFEETHPGFMAQCRSYIADVTVLPEWRPGSLSNEELVGELKFWRGVRSTLVFLGAATPGALGKKTLDAMGKSITDKAAVGGGFSSFRDLGAAALQGAKKTSPVATAGALAYWATDNSVSDLDAEVKRRGLTGEMTKYDAALASR